MELDAGNRRFRLHFGHRAHVPAKWTPVRSPRCAPSQRADKNMRKRKNLEHVPIPKERNVL
jgi:hypothetical protein